MQDRVKDLDHGFVENGWGSFEAEGKDCPLIIGIWDTKGKGVASATT